MIQLKTKISDIKKSNLVFLVETQTDLKKLDFLKLSPEIIKDIISSLREGKNKKSEYFLGNTRFSKLYIFCYKDHSKTITDAFGNDFSTLPDNFTILSNVEKNSIDLLNLAVLRKYNFQDYKTEKKKQELFFITTKEEEKTLISRIDILKCICVARDLGATPSNDLTPENFVKKAKAHKWKNFKLKIINPKDIEKKKLGLIHAVGKGSENKPYMIILERILDKKAPTYGLVGKGITFDSGGIQVKPENSMHEMKGDMCGAGAVFATMKYLDTQKLNVNIVACICLAENAISSTSYKPSDILTSYSGKTVDIIHTDAEGRLVLADGVSYVSKNYKVDNIMTVATLTGACMMALGFRYAGIMGDDRKTIDTILKQSKTGYEKYHELPFDEYFKEKCKSEIADLENLNRGIYAGSTMGGAFLSHFTMNDEKYTHLDIAGTALNSYEAYGLANKGMTGFGVESLSNFYLGL